jgi:exonuclease VII large subunit
MLGNRRVAQLIGEFWLLLLACGCSTPDTGLPAADPVSHWQAPHPSQPGGTSSSDPATPLHQPRPLVNDQNSLLSQRVASAEDDRKVLAARLQLVETQLEEKEKALAEATREIQEATAQTVRTRNELQQWKKDMTSLRDQFSNMDKDHRETLETIIKTLEQVLDHEKLPSKGFESTSPGLPGAPQLP